MVGSKTVITTFLYKVNPTDSYVKHTYFQVTIFSTSVSTAQRVLATKSRSNTKVKTTTKSGTVSETGETTGSASNGEMTTSLGLLTRLRSKKNLSPAAYVDDFSILKGSIFFFVIILISYRNFPD